MVYRNASGNNGLSGVRAARLAESEHALGLAEFVARRTVLRNV